jgi:hypothetical protein
MSPREATLLTRKSIGTMPWSIKRVENSEKKKKKKRKKEKKSLEAS